MEEHKLSVSGNSMLRRIFGAKSQGQRGGWSKFHNQGLQNIYKFLTLMQEVRTYLHIMCEIM
jgi:hypothetical protein